MMSANYQGSMLKSLTVQFSAKKLLTMMKNAQKVSFKLTSNIKICVILMLNLSQKGGNFLSNVHQEVRK